MRWRHFQGESAEDNMPSSSELNSACNARLGEKSDRVNERQKSKPRLNAKKRSNHIQLFPKFNKKSKSSEHAVNRNSILSEEEEEIAWLREEYEIETGGLKGYDWSYIEEYASPKLIKSMDEKGITLSKFPTVPGASKLLAMVRLNDPVVKEAFDQKRADVKYAIVKKKFRRNLLGKQLPAIPKAPVSKLLHQNGTRVSNIEYPKVEYITFDKENRNKITNEGEEKGNLTTNNDTPYSSQWRCDVCQEALFDTCKWM